MGMLVHVRRFQGPVPNERIKLEYSFVIIIFQISFLAIHKHGNMIHSLNNRLCYTCIL
jgi:hypothetical protein